MSLLFGLIFIVFIIPLLGLLPWSLFGLILLAIVLVVAIRVMRYPKKVDIRYRGNQEMNDSPLKKLAKSNNDRLISGVCGGLGEHTPVPSWLWRIIFIVLFFFSGLGMFVYILFWVFMPREN